MIDKILKIKEFCKENIFIMFCITLTVLFQIYYINSATVNVLFMDYWRLFNQITEKVFMGTLTWEDFWTASGMHINPFMYLMLVINMKFFGLNTRIEIFAGIFMMLATTLMLYIYYHRVINKLEYHKNFSQILYLTIIFAIFNFNQWEILTTQSSFIFMFRIFVFIGIFIFLDNSLKNIQNNKKAIIFLGIIIAFVINTMSQGYFPAMVGAVIFILLLHIFLQRKIDGFKYLKKYFLFVTFIGIGSVFYLIGVDSSNSGTFSLSFINIIKGILIMLSGSIIPIELATKYGGVSFYYTIGGIMIIIYIAAIILFFVKKMWKYNYLPMTLIMYTIINIILIYYARANLFNPEYLASSRYVCETTLGLIGVLWILINALLDEVKQGKFKNYIKKTWYIFSILFILIFLVKSIFIETKIAPYRKIYFENAIKIILNVENTDDKSLNIFQANNPKYVRDGVVLMKKYHLSIFYNNK